MQYWQSITLPLGTWRIDAHAEAVTAVSALRETTATLSSALSTQHEHDPCIERPNSVTKEACAELAAYFARTLTQFTVPLAPSGTAYQQRVWAQLQTIPYGHTWSYLQLAQSLGQPTGSRAVGMANSKNPIAVMIPCHRVIGSSGQLTGYAGGVALKADLLAHESPQPELL